MTNFDGVIKVAVLTVSDRCSRGEAVDQSGPNLQQLILSGEFFPAKVIHSACVSDDVALIVDIIRGWCDETVDFVVTTGGTGIGPRDVTPEAVRQLFEREVPGVVACMMNESLKVTPMAMLSRSVCGIRGTTLIVTLPGSKKASEECFRFIAKTIPHALDLLNDRTQNVSTIHQAVQASHHTGHLCSHKHQPAVDMGDIPSVTRRARKSPYPMISVEAAQTAVLAEAVRCIPILLSSSDSMGFVLAQDVYASDPLPPFPASIKDGYAVIAKDGAGLRSLVGCATAGSGPSEWIVTEGTCVRINTGAPVPSGADAVVQVEDTLLTKETEDGMEELEIKILKSPHVGLDIRPIGSDISKGERVLLSGTLLGAAELGVLAAVGVTEVNVYSKPKIAVLSTGNELQVPGEPLKTGHIRDSNKTTLMALASQHGIVAFDAGIARDDATSLYNALESALGGEGGDADVVVTTGGVSMGEKDILKWVLEKKFGATIHFAQVFMKPGKPTTFATCQLPDGRKRIFLALPGNPVSATVTAHLYLLPLCSKMSGRSDCLNTVVRAKLSTPVDLDPRPEYHRVCLTWSAGSDIPTASSTGNQISSRLLSMATAQALLKLPPASEGCQSLPAGSVIEAILMQC